MENLTRRNARGQRSGVIEPTQNCLFYRGIKEGLKRTDKGNHHEGPTQKTCNPSIIAPTNLQPKMMLRVNDYGEKCA